MSVLVVSGKRKDLNRARRLRVQYSVFAIMSPMLKLRPGARLVLSLFLTVAVCSGLAASEKASLDNREVYNVYPYRMKGKVRLLFFWVGKDDVGGGHIAIGRKPDAAPDAWRQDIEVLFGSNPERVPGKINRWGYGREESLWRAAASSSQPDLVRTVFEGFMKHSKEESLSEVQSNAANENAFLYDGIRSLVEPDAALSEIRTFSSAEDFDYRNSDPIHCGYRKRLEGGPPDKSRQMPNQKAYQAPFGFLTGVNSMLQSAVKGYQAGGNWTSQRPSLVYVYNAQKYRLRLKKLKLEGDFDIPLPRKDGEPEQNRTFKKVARAEFEIEKLETDYDHEFTIWFPLEGQYQGVPLRIEDKPRWWLRIELNLDPTRPTTLARTATAQLSCQ